MVVTTGGFTSAGLQLEAETLLLPSLSQNEAIEIGEDVWIGAQVIILPGSKIGSGSIIGAGSIVKGVIEPNCLAVGSPAKMVKYLGNDKK